MTLYYSDTVAIIPINCYNGSEKGGDLHGYDGERGRFEVGHLGQEDEGALCGG